MSTTSCPAWCTAGHGQLVGEDDGVHVSGMLLAGEFRLRLCQGVGEPPYVLLDGRELAIHEAEALVSGLTQLIDAFRTEVSRAGS